MTLGEVMAAATVLALAAGCSLQVWGGSLAWSQAAAQQRQQLDRLEVQLLRSRGRLRAAADQRLAASPAAFQGCAPAAAWMAEQLQAAELAPPAGLTRQLRLDEEGMVAIVYREETLGLERQRRWSPVAFGLCSALDVAP